MHGVTEETESDSDDGCDDSNGDSSDYEFLAVIAADPSVHAIEERQETSGHAREIIHRNDCQRKQGQIPN